MTTIFAVKCLTLKYIEFLKVYIRFNFVSIDNFK